LGTVKSIRAPARPVILILFFFKVHPSSWWLNLFLLGWHRSQTLENRDPFCIMLLGSTLRAILSSRQSAHARVPAILEERAMSMITHVFPLLQTFPVQRSYSSSSNSRWRRCWYWYSYFLRRSEEAGR
jgi:hypothetical protein